MWSKNIKFHKICCKLLLQFEVLVTISAKRRCAYVAYVVASMQSCTTQLHSRNHGLPGGTIHRSARQLAKKHAITMCKNSTVNTAATIERIRYRKAEIQLVWSGTAGSLSSRSWARCPTIRWRLPCHHQSRRGNSLDCHVQPEHLPDNHDE